MSTPSDAQLIAGWGGRCATAAQLARFTFYGGAAMVTRAALIDTCRAIDQVFRKWGYRARPGCGTGSMNCRPKTGGGGLSIHGLAGAWDINPCENPYGPRLITDMPAGMIADLLAIRFNNGRQVLTWGGSWRGNKDAMHLQTAGLPSDVATGINQATVARPSGSTVVLAPKTTTAPTTTIESEEDDDMKPFIIRYPTGEYFYVAGCQRVYINDPHNKDITLFLGVPEIPGTVENIEWVEDLTVEIGVR